MPSETDVAPKAISGTGLGRKSPGGLCQEHLISKSVTKTKVESGLSKVQNIEVDFRLWGSFEFTRA